ncbi:phosphatase PAP2 family protein [Natrarchaeobius chitinivorans]|uniref:Inositol phosphorylceramide synthase n=1 Tax=Natrarchaeobius chitinivorans TaxID=1679083 RepID=A0A3N6NDR5_NATCH|nr:phosphatase PAP2 family protein [Natrarchaeobius chitinivorans]RQG96982.1 inositol phosphorylceramide synthase [Natrarchaeobius chitinivorans]
MSLVGVVLELALVVTTMLVVATLVLVGPRRVASSTRDFRWRLRRCTLPLAVLVFVLALRWSTVDIVVRLERRVLGIEISGFLFELEQSIFPENPVVILQSFQSPELTSFFVFVYIYGYAFLLLFPFIAYFALEEIDELRTLILAFAANYGIGLICYIFFVAFGPRNYDPLLFEGLLYDAFPQARMLTNQVNQSTNVFPSLHTSLSMTVFFLAWLSREKYPLWVPISGFFAVSVVISTMYLGIHWFSDVVAGTILALVSVYIARNFTIRETAGSARRYLNTRLDRSDRVDGD